MNELSIWDTRKKNGDRPYEKPHNNKINDWLFSTLNTHDQMMDIVISENGVRRLGSQ